MQDQIAELAARLNSASTEDELNSVDLSIYHVRKDRRNQHELTVNFLLAQIATMRELHEAEDDKLRELERLAEKKLEPFTAIEAA